MEIEINDKYRIKSYDRNIVVERKHITDPTKAPNWKQLEAKGADPSPKVKWREVSYHSTVPQAIQFIGEQTVRDSEATTLRELLEEIREFNGEIRELLAIEGKS